MAQEYPGGHPFGSWIWWEEDGVPPGVDKRSQRMARVIIMGGKKMLLPNMSVDDIRSKLFDYVNQWVSRHNMRLRRSAFNPYLIMDLGLYFADQYAEANGVQDDGSPEPYAYSRVSAKKVSRVSRLRQPVQGGPLLRQKLKRKLFE